MSENKQSTILIVDDEPVIVQMLCDYFRDDYECLGAESGRSAIDLIHQRADIAAVILDIKMMPIDGCAVAKEIQASRPNTNILFHTAHMEYDEAQIDSTLKPFDFIRKGGSLPRLRRSVKNAVESFRYRTNPASQVAEALIRYEMVGCSPKMLELFEKIRVAAATDVKVLIEGESGTGKELVARAIHRCSKRCNGPLALLQGYARSADMIEAELFGHRKGSFTDAKEDRLGKFEYANGGTLFIDEISNLDLRTQAFLLRVIETGEFQRVGEPASVKCSVRTVAATNKPLRPMVAAGEFREDLYFRLREMVITVPPLRDRREDIPILIKYFVEKYLAEHDISPKQFDAEAVNVLMAQDFEGNVRDLRYCVEYLVETSPSDMILATDVKRYLDHTGGCTLSEEASSLNVRVRQYRRACVIEALQRHHNNIRQTAAYLKLDPGNLSRLLKELDIPRKVELPVD